MDRAVIELKLESLRRMNWAMVHAIVHKHLGDFDQFAQITVQPPQQPRRG